AVDGTVLDTLSDAQGLGGLAVAPNGTVYAADPAHHQVLVLGGTALGGLDRPVAVAVAPDGTVYVADAGDGRVHAFRNGVPAGDWAAAGALSVAASPDGTVFVAEAQTNQITHRNPDGTLIETFSGVNVPHGIATD